MHSIDNIVKANGMRVNVTLFVFKKKLTPKRILRDEFDSFLTGGWLRLDAFRAGKV